MRFLESPFFRRKQLLINNKLQIQIIAYGCLVGIFSSYLTGVFIRSQVFEYSSNSKLLLVAFIIIFLFCCISVLGLYFTNRIFGPLFRLHQELKSLNQGIKVQKITLREGDQFSELIEEFNSYLKTQGKI